jgi:uncharacterized protein (TIGR00725 family)
MYVAVIGGQQCTPEEERTAYDLGNLLAKNGAIIICGGLGGVMEAACKGAKAAGGTTIGILPGPFRGDANPFVDFAVATDMGQARNAIIVRTAEVAMALKMGKKVVAISSWEISRKGALDEKVIRVNDPAKAVEIILGSNQH